GQWPRLLEEDESEAAPLGPLFERWMDEYGQCVRAEPLRPRAAGSSAVAGDGPGIVLLAAEEQDLLAGGGWDYFDLQEAYALQELGLAKVEATAAACRLLNPDLIVNSHVQRFRRSSVNELAALNKPAPEVDVVVFSCVDDVTARRLIWESTRDRIAFFAD